MISCFFNLFFFFFYSLVCFHVPVDDFHLPLEANGSKNYYYGIFLGSKKTKCKDKEKKEVDQSNAETRKKILGAEEKSGH